jgi:hypothetical protein
MRVMLGLVEVAGYYTGLQQGLRELGVEADLVTLNRHRLAYQGSTPQPRVAEALIAPARRLRECIGAARGVRRTALRCVELPVRAVSQLALMTWALCRYDVFIVGFNASFLRTHDLRLLRMFRKRIIAVYHGSDSRAPYLDGFVAREADGRTLARLTCRVSARVRRMERYADVIVCGPLSTHLHHRPVVVFQKLGIPVRDVPPAPPPSPSREVVVVHAPSDPEGKGTERIRAIIAALRDQGTSVRLEEIQGRPNAEVLTAIASADMVVDQLYSDTHLASLGVEAACLGRPTVVGTYDAAELSRILGEDAQAAVVCHPDEVADVVRSLCIDARARLARGEAAHNFVARQWQRRAIAERMLRLVRGDVPDSWLFDPHDLRAFHGVGLDADALRRRVAAVVRYGGPRALLMDDKPALLEAMLETLDIA